jgi:hypothetical protein
MKLAELLLEASDREIRETIAEWRNEFKRMAYSKMSFGSCRVENGKIIHTSEKLAIYQFMLKDGKLAAPFESAIKVDVWANVGTLSSFENFPKEIVYGNVKASKIGQSKLHFNYAHDRLTSLEYFPRNISGSISTYNLRNLSLSRCNKHIDKIDGTWFLNTKYVGPILGTLQIKGLREVSFGSEAQSILTKYLRGDRDILECQEELITKGFKEYAKL